MSAVNVRMTLDHVAQAQSLLRTLYWMQWPTDTYHLRRAGYVCASICVWL